MSHGHTTRTLVTGWPTLLRPLIVVALLLVGLVDLAHAQVPGSPGTPKASFGTPGATTIPLTLTWTASPPAVAVSYSITGDFESGGAAFTATTSALTLTRAMPYHPSGAAAAAWTCVRAVAGSQQSTPSCSGFTVSAKPVGPPPPSTTVTLRYDEPRTNADGTTLTDLASVRAYWRIGSGPESVVTYLASGTAGGQPRTQSLTVPATSGTLTVQVTAVDTAGQESARSATASKVIAPPTAVPGAPTAKPGVTIRYQ